MTRRQYIVRGSIAAGVAAAAWLLFFVLPRWTSPQPEQSPSAEAATVEGGRRINASLFYVAEDGLRLVPVSREVPYQPDATEQARALIQAQLEPVAAPYVSAVPAGTTLRTLFITEDGEAFVDLSREVAVNHPGGSLDEIFTVYALVNALTANIPAVTAVQILVDGKEVDTLAGHIDLRHPLRRGAEPAPTADQ
jgi:spore germination protein GerM